MSMGSSRQKDHKQGVYLYGPVGRGKTYLMDLFYESVQAPKRRLHFYELMREVHGQLQALKGASNPLNQVSKAIAQGLSLLCIDEFFVEDVADAMILKDLLRGLFESGIFLVLTSNAAPESLYLEGLKRDAFLGAIDLIEGKLVVLSLNHSQDYRTLLQPQDSYRVFSRKSEKAAQDFYLQACFQFYTQAYPSADAQSSLPRQFQLNGHPIKALLRSAHVACFEFDELCIQPRLAQDYLELAESFKVVLIANLPQLTPSDEEAARRFISLVDTCYDKKVHLVIAAAVPLSDLYQGQRLKFQFERTLSRLTQMSAKRQ